MGGVYTSMAISCCGERGIMMADNVVLSKNKCISVAYRLERIDIID